MTASQALSVAGEWVGNLQWWQALLLVLGIAILGSFTGNE